MEGGLHSPFLLPSKWTIQRSISVYAVVRDRGAQYRVEEGQTLDVALMDAEPGAEVSFDEVLLVGGTDDPIVGETNGEKIIVFKYRNKKRYRRRTGHRQHYTRLSIKEIRA
jgi:large subunit ribosomal protein L21